MIRKSNQFVASESSERGAALATAIFMMAILAAIAMSVLAVVNTESRIAGSDLQRTQTFYAGAAGIEKMTTDFSALFSRTSRPTRRLSRAARPRVPHRHQPLLRRQLKPVAQQELPS
jgi:Tfp pilus assembly protein PilX